MHVFKERKKIKKTRANETYTSEIMFWCRGPTHPVGIELCTHIICRHVYTRLSLVTVIQRAL